MPVNSSDSFPKISPDSKWRILGEFELPVGANTSDTLHTWLTGILVPLNLSTDFLDRALHSAQVSTARALQSNDIMSVGHIHLSVFTPHAEHDSKRKTWGFFHISRIENRAEGAVTQDHAIDFYLYVEGE
jgi:hypothetical protein